MKLSTLLLVSLGATTAQANIHQMNVVYGKDNRLDVYQVSNASLLKLASSTAGMVPIRQLSRIGQTNAFNIVGARNHGDAEQLCSQEKFANQSTAPICSGFLVAPDVIVTAGHCYKSMGTPESACRSYAWVFDYKMTSASSDPTKNVSVNNVYTCKSVVRAELTDTLDFAVIKLDRPVVGRTPLKIRTTGKVSNVASLVVIGHPSGLPTKISGGAKVTKNTHATQFSTTLDTFHGNSGSAVFDAATGQVEGILIQGKTDYVPSIRSNPMSCRVVNVCDDNGNNCAGGLEAGNIAFGEVVLRIGAAAPYITQAAKLKLK